MQYWSDAPTSGLLPMNRPAAIAAMVLGLGGMLGDRASGAANDGRDTAEKSHGAALHHPAHRDPRLHFSCGDALDDGTLLDAHQVDVFAALARGLRWGLEGPPPEGHPTVVRLICGPDLDGDGDKEAIVVATFPSARDASDDVASIAAPTSATYTWLASKHATTWRAVAPIAFDVSDAPDGQPAPVFVRRARGVLAIEVEHKSFASAGCHLTTYEVFALVSGALQRLEVGDRSTTCAPCGCDPR